MITLLSWLLSEGSLEGFQSFIQRGRISQPSVTLAAALPIWKVVSSSFSVLVWFGWGFSFTCFCFKESVLHSLEAESEKSKRPGCVSVWPWGVPPVVHQFPSASISCLDGRDKTMRNVDTLQSPRHSDFDPDLGAQSCLCSPKKYLATLPWVHSPVCSVLLSSSYKSQHLLLRGVHASPQTAKCDQTKNVYAVCVRRREKLKWQTKARNLENISWEIAELANIFCAARRWK